jgi:hypothetical protein
MIPPISPAKFDDAASSDAAMLADTSEPTVNAQGKLMLLHPPGVTATGLMEPPAKKTPTDRAMISRPSQMDH